MRVFCRDEDRNFGKTCLKIKHAANNAVFCHLTPCNLLNIRQFICIICYSFSPTLMIKTAVFYQLLLPSFQAAECYIPADDLNFHCWNTCKSLTLKSSVYRLCCGFHRSRRYAYRARQVHCEPN